MNVFSVINLFSAKNYTEIPFVLLLSTKRLRMYILHQVNETNDPIRFATTRAHHTPIISMFKKYVNIKAIGNASTIVLSTVAISA